MRATLLLCDWAEVVAGKVYAQGAGWSTTSANTPGVASALAVFLYVPYDMTNRLINVRCQLLTSDGQPFPEGSPAEFGYEFEVGRPPGIKPGFEQIVPFAAKVNGIIYSPGVYEWRMEVDGSALASATFTAIEG